jgi:spore coat protein A, manganese oxidase
MKRREFIKGGVLSSIGVMAHRGGLGLTHLQSVAQMGELSPKFPNSSIDDNSRSLSLPPYVDPLPVLPVIEPNGSHKVSIGLKECLQKTHRDLPPTRVWGYDGTWPGPTIKVRSEKPITVDWINELPTKHFLPIDTTLHGAGADLPEVRTVTHVHGARVMPGSDGYPEAWSTSDGKTGSHHSPAPYRYPNAQPAATLWYHDHAMGINRLNIYAGLAGFYLIGDEQEDSLNLPQGEYDIPIMIQDRQFNADGSLSYPVVHDGTHPVWVQEFFGSVNCLNGKAAPYLEVEPRKYRFRLLNGSNSRFYHLTLLPADESGNVAGKPTDAPAFHQIGTDGGLLESPLPLHYLILSPAERFDVIIDFSNHRGRNLAIINDAPAPYPRGGQVVAREVLLFRVNKPLIGRDNSGIPNKLATIPLLDPAAATQERFLSLTEMERPSDGYTVIGLLGEKHWNEPVTESPKAGSMEIWSFVNTTGDVHPMHIHLVRFQVLNRQSFNVNVYLQTKRVVYTGIPRAPEANERPAWKDTVKTYPGTITRVIAKFDLPDGEKIKAGMKFRYVWHCHILEHEDNEMMRPYEVVV